MAGKSIEEARAAYRAAQTKQHDSSRVPKSPVATPLPPPLLPRLVQSFSTVYLMSLTLSGPLHHLLLTLQKSLLMVTTTNIALALLFLNHTLPFPFRLPFRFPIMLRLFQTILRNLIPHFCLLSLIPVLCVTFPCFCLISHP